MHAALLSCLMHECPPRHGFSVFYSYWSIPRNQKKTGLLLKSIPFVFIRVIYRIVYRLFFCFVTQLNEFEFDLACTGFANYRKIYIHVLMFRDVGDVPGVFPKNWVPVYGNNYCYSCICRSVYYGTRMVHNFFSIGRKNGGKNYGKNCGDCNDFSGFIISIPINIFIKNPSII